MRRSLAAALPLAVALTIATPALASGVDADPTSAPPAVGVAEPAPRPAGRPSLAEAAAALAYVEPVIAAYSGFVTWQPELAGMIAVGYSPFRCSGANREKGWWSCGADAAGFAAVGLYNALELGRERYSRGERFWRSVVSWNALLAWSLASGALLGRDVPERAPAEGGAAVSLAYAADGTPLVAIAGRF